MKILQVFVAVASFFNEFQLVLGSPQPKRYNGVHDQYCFTPGQPVKTTSGTVIGKVATYRDQVSEYLGIPFAQPPVGALRFAAPRPFLGSGFINATKFSPDCAANLEAISTSEASSLGLAGTNSDLVLAELIQSGDITSEDCLTLNIWTKPQSGEKAKAVLFWIYGGGFQTGNTNNPTYDGEYFADEEDVIVVSANYRLNVFGFPGLPDQPDAPQNPGLLDQRLAVEWVRDNIAAFGGDPNRITIFGQSAGGTSVDYYSYAWTENPIVAGFIPESGTAVSFATPAPPNNTAAWFNASQILGCGGELAGIPVTLACVRNKSTSEILAATRTTNPLMAVLGQFGPTADEQVVFSNYSTRAAEGKFIQKPYFTGNNDYEAGLFKVLAKAGNERIPDILWAIFNLAVFTCPASDAANVRATHNVPVWRYRYFGEFPNLRLTSVPNSGAWHGSEISVVWGTAQNASQQQDTPVEQSISSYLMGVWASFAKNPECGFDEAPYEFPTYDQNMSTLIRFAYMNQTQPSYISPITFDYACSTLETLAAPIPGGLLGALNQLSSGSASPAAEAFLGGLNNFANLSALGGGNPSTM
ncbi:alpha/beta-hydrolase [Viridothelium virens]|uniref:Carboxylic ester hydrolase n=1 Tax=Viridothelium virens TaxID=1048519 RepID=A0A6A6GXT6_VIRVR|nr:alpha/beta-hydrolase [Viridothelium virens]